MNQLYRKFCVIMLSIMVTVTFCPAGVFAASEGDAAAKAASVEQKEDEAQKKAEEQKKAEAEDSSRAEQ